MVTCLFRALDASARMPGLHIQGPLAEARRNGDSPHPGRRGTLLGLDAAFSILGGRVLNRTRFGYIMMQKPVPISL